MAQFDRYGGPEVLEVREVPRPTPRADEVLVRVHASGLNPKDPLVRSGAVRLLSGRRFPRGTGSDFAGEVVEAGKAVQGLPAGTRVWGFLDGFLGGAAADYLVVRRKWLAPAPERLGWLEAAALPLVASTALQALRDCAHLRADERLLIQGAGGGVGNAAIQIAKGRGAEVTALASGDALERCRALGADHVIDYHITDPATLPGPFDVLLDCVGGTAYTRYRRLFARGGRWVTTAPSPRVFLLRILANMVAPVGGGPRLRFVAVRPRRADLEQLALLVELGHLRMPVTAAYPLEAIREAHAAVAELHGRGKRVLAISPEALSESG